MESSCSRSPCCQLRALRGVDRLKYCIVVQEVQRSSCPFCLLFHCVSLSYGLYLFIPQLYSVRVGGVVFESGKRLKVLSCQCVCHSTHVHTHTVYTKALL